MDQSTHEIRGREWSQIIQDCNASGLTKKRYFAIMYDHLHEILRSYHVIQADETPCNVAKDVRPANSKSYMCVYRTGKTYKDKPIILYDFQKTRSAEHLQEFLKGFKGVVVTDGYSAYQKMDKENPDIVFAGW